MTIKLGWPHVLAAFVLAILLTVLSIMAVKRAAQRDIVDAERVARIEELEELFEDALDGSRAAHAAANEERDARRETEGELDKYRESLRMARNRAIPCAEERGMLRDQNDLLEVHLASSLQESLHLRQALSLSNIALDHKTEQFDLNQKRYTALKRSKKKDRRRSIFSAVGIAVGGFGFGYGMAQLSN